MLMRQRAWRPSGGPDGQAAPSTRACGLRLDEEGRTGVFCFFYYGHIEISLSLLPKTLCVDEMGKSSKE